MSEPLPHRQPEPEPPTPPEPLLTARERERQDRKDADPLPGELSAALRGIPGRLRTLQMAGIWVGGILLGATVVNLPCIAGARDPLHVVRLLTTPVLSFFCYSWSTRLEESPFRFGAGICGTALCLALEHGIAFVSTLSALPETGFGPLHGILAVMLLGPLWLATFHLGSLRLLSRYSQARIEFPEAVGSLWSPADRRKTRQLLHTARWWPILVGFLLTLVTVVWSFANVV